jgi:thioesterase domain-containing protein
VSVTPALVTLSRGGELHPLFLVHGLSGTALPFLELSTRLDPARSCIGVQARGIDGAREPLDRVEAIAAAHVDAILEIYPADTYLLAGWSFGGLVALEMALQLGRAKKKVALAILDCHGLRPASAEVELEPGLKAALRRVAEAHLRARERYVAGSYPGDVTLFRAIESAAEIEDSTLGFGKLVQGALTVETVPGDHHSMLQPPAVTHLARSLSAWLRRQGDGR